MAEKNMRESLEKNLINQKQKENTVIRTLLQMKKEQEKIAEEDKIKTPWLHIRIEDLSEEALSAYAAFVSEDFETAQAKIKELKIKLDDMKKKDGKASNENFARWIDDKIDEKRISAQLKAEREMDNN